MIRFCEGKGRENAVVNDLTAIDLADAMNLGAIVVGYLLGSIPFGLLLTRLAGHGDIRAIGSGNIGATNVLRTGNKGLAAATLVLDALKGTAAVFAGSWLGGPDAALLAGVAAFLGHLFPAWLGFKGGKGVATFIGVTAGLVWQAVPALAVAWILVALVTRYSSLAALVASVVATIAVFVFATPLVGIFFVAMTALIFIRHKANIERLRAGTENRIGRRKHAA
jgi:glycerol-3-phosphate acyltransferase PlsY